MSPEQLLILGYSFPKLSPTNSRATSPLDLKYNCVAWALGNNREWWWPDPENQGYWPSGIKRSVDILAFRQLFDLWGYTEPSDPSVDVDISKIALFTDARGTPMHVARQLPDGWWASKLGTNINIEHELAAVEGPAYGTVAVILARPIPLNTPELA